MARFDRDGLSRSRVAASLPFPAPPQMVNRGGKEAPHQGQLGRSNAREQAIALAAPFGELTANVQASRWPALHESLWLPSRTNWS